MLKLIFGDLATREKARRFLWIALVVIGADLITKLLALWLAPVDIPLKLWGGAMEIQRVENARLLGTARDKAGNLSQIFVSGVVTLLSTFHD
jgi:lipoprotein signal peptidase